MERQTTYERDPKRNDRPFDIIELENLHVIELPERELMTGGSALFIGVGVSLNVNVGIGLGHGKKC